MRLHDREAETGADRRDPFRRLAAMQLQQLRIEGGDRRRERRIAGIDRQQNLAGPSRGMAAETGGQVQRHMPWAFVEKNKAQHVGAIRQRRVETRLRGEAADFDYDAHGPDTRIARRY